MPAPAFLSLVLSLAIAAGVTAADLEVLPHGGYFSHTHTQTPPPPRKHTHIERKREGGIRTFICCSLRERGGLFVLALAFLSLVLPPVLTAGVAAADLEVLPPRRILLTVCACCDCAPLLLCRAARRPPVVVGEVACLPVGGIKGARMRVEEGK